LVYALGLRYAVAEFVREGARITLRLFAVQMLSLAIYMSSFITAFFVVFSSAHTLAGELEGEEILAVVARPVHRWEVLMGKFAGIATASIGFSAALILAIVIISTTISGQSFGNIPRVVGLYCLQPLVLLSVTLVLSIFMKTIAAGITGMLLYMIGVIGGSTEQIIAIVSPSSNAVDMAAVARFLMPTDTLYRLIYTSLGADLRVPFANAGPFGAIVVPGWWMVAYAAAYIAVFLAIGVVVFHRKDL
jgi:ABC-type transport system involved in multi-copper enzyme maturation permease subunit